MTDNRPGWDLYVCRRHVHDMLDSLEKRGVGICKRRHDDSPLPVFFISARDALSTLERELKKREISEINKARYFEDEDDTAESGEN